MEYWIRSCPAVRTSVRPNSDLRDRPWDHFHFWYNVGLLPGDDARFFEILKNLKMADFWRFFVQKHRKILISQ